MTSTSKPTDYVTRDDLQQAFDSFGLKLFKYLDKRFDEVNKRIDDLDVKYDKLMTHSTLF
jgi:hypothetical protein